ncbi:MAG TPA: outer membrane lipoprotein carrier protein LolA, partial [Thermopetrobacter sp.]|nr:outer membrane lipoprotein carrier protein LolA [Thermopetrobacter sp.]
AAARKLDGERRAAVNRISGFLNSFRTLKGEFTQISPRGRVSTGRLYIARPGRMRFEYQPPNPIVIVSDGTWVAIRNNNRNSVDYFPLSKTPLRMILAERVDLAREADIRKVERRDDLLIVTLKDRDRSVDGHLVLIFDEKRNSLQQWIVVDGQGRRTTVTLNSLQPGVKLSARLFRVKRPEEAAFERQRRKRTNFGARR